MHDISHTTTISVPNAKLTSPESDDWDILSTVKADHNDLRSKFGKNPTVYSIFNIKSWPHSEKLIHLGQHSQNTLMQLYAVFNAEFVKNIPGC